MDASDRNDDEAAPTDPAVDPDQEDGPRKEPKEPSPAQLLMAMADDQYRLVRSTDSRNYAVPKFGPKIALPLASKGEGGLRARLSTSMFRQTGKVANAGALSDVINVLEGEACELTPEPVYLRMGRCDGAIVVDMGTATGQAIVITAAGWRTLGTSPVIFRRSPLTHPLPEPQRGGTLDPLRDLINLPDDEFRLCIGWVVAAYFMDLPHPILLIQGEQGTAKSTLIRTLLALVDPQPADDRHPPVDKREWAIFARASWAFSYDNITQIPDWLSNSLCKGVTGDAVLQRVLHSDEDIAVFAFQRVMAMTTVAIESPLKGDLVDRMLLVEPEVIEHRKSETEIRTARTAALPAALGAVLDLVSAVLARLPAVQVDQLPRMADFARILAALDQVTGWTTLATYRDRIHAMGMTLIEGNTFAHALFRFATHQPWEGTTGQLLDALAQVCHRYGMATADLPGNTNRCGIELTQIAPSLRKVGVDIRRRRTGPKRLITITKTDPPTS